MIKLIEDMLESQPLKDKNVELLKSELKEAELNGRLKAYGLADNEIENMKKLMEKVTIIKKRLSQELNKYANEALSLDKYSHLPQNKLNLRVCKRNAVSNQVNLIVDVAFTMFPKLKSLLSDQANNFESKVLHNLDSFVDLTLQEPQLLKTDILNQMDKKIKFLEKWQGRLAVDAIQGLKNRQETIKIGVCLAKCLRVGHFEQTHPDLPVDKIGGEGLTPMDRFEQVRCGRLLNSLQGLTTEDKMSVAKEVSRKYGYNEHVWFGLFSDEAKIKQDFIECIKSLPFDAKNSEQLKLSNGVLHITIYGKDWGHAMHCRVDLERRIFRLHDPNIGIFQIPLPAEEPLSKATNELAELLSDVLETYYPDTDLGGIYQFIKKND
jgi:hypothetical protein